MAAGKSPIRRLVQLTILLMAVILASVLVGSVDISMSEVIRAVLAGEMRNTQLNIFLYSRLPRMLGGIMCGCGLAVSGAILQVVLNNALAGPNIIGVNAGAGFSALLVLALFPFSVSLLPAASFLGALTTTLLIYGISRYTHSSRMTIVLAGVAVSSVINAASSCIKTLFPDVLLSYNSFSVGTLNGVTMDELWSALPYLIIGTGAAMFLSGDMNVLSLGEELAQSLGLKAERCRLLLIMTASVLAGTAVSIAGLLGFVGLLVPHIARILFGSDNRIVIPASALLGAAAVLLCDLLGRTLFAPFEIPVGIILSLGGGVYFVVLLLRKRGGKLHD